MNLETELDWEGHRTALLIEQLGASEAQTRAVIAFGDYRRKVYALEQALPTRRDRLLADLAAEGASRCGYSTGAAQWVNGTCDCKYRQGFAVDMRWTSEQTGCCEIRAAYWLLAGDPS